MAKKKSICLELEGPMLQPYSALSILLLYFCRGGGGVSFGGTVQNIEESNIYLCFVVCRLKRGLVT